MTTHFAARAWADLRQHWRIPLAFHLLMQLLGLSLFAPLLTLVASGLVRASGEPVVSNFDMAAFALSPAGILFMLVMAALFIALLLAQFAGHTWIAGHAIANRQVTLWSTLAMVLRLLPRLIVLGARLFLRVLLLLSPLLALVAVIWFSTLAGRDINYYLAEQPAEWRRALLIVAAAACLSALLVLGQVVRWLFAVPVLLLEGASTHAALKRSRELTQGRVMRIMLPLVLWWLLLTGVTIAVTWLFRQASDAGLDWAGITASRVLPLVAIYLVVSFSGAFLSGAIWIASHQFMVTRLYVERLGDKVWQPPASGAGLEAADRRYSFPLLKALPVLVLLAFGAVWLIATRVNLHSEVAITAHRGASISHPENTMAAFRAAMAAGADFIELDVQRVRDRVIVVVHDGDLMRLGGDPRKVRDLDAAELATIDIGRKYNASFAGEFAPTLEQVIELVRGRLKINVELKYNFPDPGLAPAVIDLLRAQDFIDQVVITSLDYSALRQVKSIEPRLLTGHIVTTAVGNVVRSEADFLSLNAARATAALIRRLHAAGKDVHVWTVNTPEAMLRMIERGADSIITDDPALLKRVILERNALSRTELLGLRLRVLFDIPPREVTDPAAVKTL